MTAFSFQQKKPFIIAGPCSAESRQQMLTTAKQLQPVNPQLFRAGIWKPRSRPTSFQGMGETALKWLQEVKVKFNIPVAAEAGNAAHAELCLRYGIDVIWIGARTTVNPFAVQEIADALKGAEVAVMIKNPVNPDLDLWTGAIERVAGTGIKEIAAVHRGFSDFQKTKYRNSPMWEIPIELKRRFPDLPLFCDPSHIAGKRGLLQHISQRALDLGFDGLMIETHYDPQNALSDKEQQIAPAELKELLNNLIIRQTSSDNISFLASLEELRDVIDKLDEDLLMLLKERIKIVEQIGLYKKENNITIYQPERWDEILRTRGASALKKNLSPELIRKMLELIHQESIRIQTQVMNEEAQAKKQ